MLNFCLIVCLCSLFVAEACQPCRAQSGQAGDPSRAMPPPAERYDPGDPGCLRLWSSRAPGATGDDTARDIPFLRVFPAPPTTGRPAPAILLIPGGGYDHLTDTKEQGPVAEYLSRQLHVTTFVLRYRLVQPDGTYRYPVPMWDGQRALKLLRHRAGSLGIDPNRVGVFGFSAGGHLAAMLALHPDDDFGLPRHDAVDAEDARPTLLGLGYPVLSMDPAAVPPSGAYHHLLHGFEGSELQHLQTFLSAEQNVTRHVPPVFLFESLDDRQISAQNSILFVDAMRRTGRPIEAHLFAHGKHGSGLSQGIAEEQAWPTMFQRWLLDQHFL